MFVLFKKTKFSKKGFITLFLLFLIIFSILIINSSALATVTDDAKNTLDTTAQNARITTEGVEPPSTESIIGSGINMVLGLFGLVFFLLVIYGGITWMTAGGNDEKAQKARKILTRSSIGVIIIVAAYLVANVIIFRLLDIATTP